MGSRAGCILLMFLSPFIAELLTGSTKPWQFLNPLNLAILMLFYGSAAVLIREAWVRGGLGAAALLMFGAA